MASIRSRNNDILLPADILSLLGSAGDKIESNWMIRVKHFWEFANDIQQREASVSGANIAYDKGTALLQSYKLNIEESVQ